jgi:hypothetical protein
MTFLIYVTTLYAGLHRLQFYLAIGFYKPANGMTNNNGVSNGSFMLFLEVTINPSEFYKMACLK